MAESPEDLTHLVIALKTGDRDAYRELVHHMGDPLLRYAATITGDHDLAHDVVQDAFLRIYRLKRKLDEHKEFRGLCFRITRNLARNAVRDESLRRRREQEAGEMRGGEDHEGQALAKAAWEQVRKLPTALREVLELRFAFGLNRAEIASTLEVPEGTVATRQRKGIEQVRNQMSVGAPALATLLAMPQPSTPTPDLFYMEELVMNGIRSMRIKSAGRVATAALVILLLGFAGTATAISMTSNQSSPRDALTIAATDSNDASDPAPADPVRETTVQNPEPTQSNAPANTEPASTPELPPEPSQEPEREPTTQPRLADPEPATPKREETPPVVEPVQVAPEFISMPVQKAAVGHEYLYLIEVKATPVAELTAEILPRWLKLEDNLLIGTPDMAEAGSVVRVTLKADNGVAPAAHQHFEINVDAAPQITSKPDTEAVAGKEYKYTVVVKATPDATLSLTDAPGWLSLRGDEVVGTPDRADAGETKEIKLTASNGIKPDAEQTWKITVNCPPEFTSSAVTTVKVGEEYSYTIEVSGYPAPTLRATSLPKWLSLDGNILSGTPRTADLGKSRKMTLHASNGERPNASQRFTILVDDNPDYVEIPWDEDELKDFFKVGMKWEVAKLDSPSFAGPNIVYLRDKYEVTAIDTQAGTITVSHKFLVPEVKAGRERYVYMDGATTTLPFNEYAAQQLIWLAGFGKVTYTAKQKVKINGRTETCHMYEVTGMNEGTTVRLKGMRLYFIEGKPGIVARRDDLMETNGKRDWKIGQELVEFSTK